MFWVRWATLKFLREPDQDFTQATDTVIHDSLVFAVCELNCYNYPVLISDR